MDVNVPSPSELMNKILLKVVVEFIPSGPWRTIVLKAAELAFDSKYAKQITISAEKSIRAKFKEPITDTTYSISQCVSAIKKLISQRIEIVPGMEIKLNKEKVQCWCAILDMLKVKTD